MLHWVSAELSPPLSLSSFSPSYQSTSLARRMEVPSQPSAKKHSINNVGPSPATARDDDVGLVVARAKKAAASLWMMIHAEVRRIVLQHFGHILCRLFRYVSRSLRRSTNPYRLLRYSPCMMTSTNPTFSPLRTPTRHLHTLELHQNNRSMSSSCFLRRNKEAPGSRSIMCI